MAVFHAKAFLLQRMRGMRNLQQGIRRHPQRLDVVADDGRWQELAVSRSALWTDPTPTEQWYQLGKVENLRRAASRIDGVVHEPEAVFSFWQQVGRATSSRGFARGRMLLEGCLIPAVGGGLCQLSNALYQVALDSGAEIIERHTHSRIVPGSATAAGRDATVAWNYIDLRFRHRQRIRLSVKLTTTELVVQLFADSSAAIPSTTAAPEPLHVAPIGSDHACDSCGKLACHLCVPALVDLWSRRLRAFLLDGAWPEYFDWVSAYHSPNDHLFIPLDGSSWNRPNYLWPLHGFARIHTATLQTLIRAWRSRRLAAQGAERQKALLHGAEQLARAYARDLTPEMDELIVAQNLLPFLWRMGVLGGRRVRVLMQQMPIASLEATLDRAAAAHLESHTLRDFRAEPWLREAETRALDEAAEIITPHAAIARLFPGKARLLPWATTTIARVQRSESNNRPARILFPSSTLGRKGAFELRDVLTELRRDFDFTLLLGGRELEGVGFWADLPVESTRETNLADIDLVVLPTIAESQPRTLLRALAAAVPVITTRESGLHENSGAEFVDVLNVASLRDAIRMYLQK
jgi:hypothetical protein